MTSYRRGDVVLVLFPHSNLRTAKRRPAVDDQASRAGLLMDSVIMTDNLASVKLSEIDRVIGRFLTMNEIDNGLRATLAL